MIRMLIDVFYRHFENVENNIEQVLKDAYNEGLEDIENLDDIKL